jgi:alginate O-acetyltransferase complex protein AlgI
VLVTFHFVTVCWIIFRAPDLTTFWSVATGPLVARWGDMAVFAAENAFVLLLVAVFFLLHRWDDHHAVRRLVKGMPKAVFWPMLIFLWLLAITVSQGSSAKFIYFDF